MSELRSAASQTRASKLRAGVVGLGLMGRVHVLGLRAAGSYDVVACADASSAGRATAAKLGVDAFFTSGADLLQATDLDVLTIATPPNAHRALVVAAAARGLHIICEKPFALDASEAAEMVDAAARASTVNVVDHQLRFNANRIEMRQRLRDGYVGSPRAARLHGTYPGVLDQPWSWWSSGEAGGGLLGEYGSHAIDLLRWLLGDVVHVSGRALTFVRERRDPAGGTTLPVDSDDYADFQLRFESGAVANVLLNGITTSPSPIRELEIQGDRGRLWLDASERLWGQRREAAEPEELTEPENSPSLIGSQTEFYTQPFLRLARHFAAATRGGPIDPMPTFADGLAIQRVLDAIRRPELQAKQEA